MIAGQKDDKGLFSQKLECEARYPVFPTICSVLIGVRSSRRSASQAIDLPNDRRVNLGRLFTPALASHKSYD
jgi:hypothetical protein